VLLSDEYNKEISQKVQFWEKLCLSLVTGWFLHAYIINFVTLFAMVTRKLKRDLLFTLKTAQDYRLYIFVN
jgi:hypothetical protein